ncbi:uncharacterized protein LOC127250833 isoform X2 [Andrographis paniculata]|uniref:uncharacterized protein LOC127250833 isoform X2 n=1 Tax=Andrographis paniculata TaxID=175694 RepID=UPI0021E9727A|nr:uncharacterized protein LOC127250833 isoform X2 [Andrographis paniculata]
MERARHRKSKSASGIEGIVQAQKHKDAARLSSDSRSYVEGRNRNDMSSSAWATGIPMKKLLAEEMSKEVGSKKQSPSVIAKLMGLEGMPSPRHSHRQQRRSSESSINSQKNSHLYDGQFNKRRSNDHQEFKDVYEDLEASHVGNRRCSSRWNASSILTKPEMALIKQKFNDAKRLSTDEKLQYSKELDDTLEMLDSNKDLLLEYLHEPDSLFVKHLHDIKNESKSSTGSHIAVLKPSNPGMFESKAKMWRSERNTSNKHHPTSHLKREDGLLLEPHSRHRARISHHSSRIQLEEKNEDHILPTKIVVLKPNLGKMQNDGVSGFLFNLSNGYHPSFKKVKEFQKVGGSDTVACTRKDLFHDEGFSKPISKEAREIAREITMRMRNGYHDTEMVDAKSMKFKGYAGDESSFDANESDSESDSEEFKLSSGKTFSDSEYCRYTHHSAESSVSREAKKRLSERWITTHKYQDLEMVSKGSTLGEMLSLPDRETRPRHFSGKTHLDRSSNQLSRNNGAATRNGPIGISSRDGWKDNVSRHVSGSRSLSSYTNGRSTWKSSCHDDLPEDSSPMHIRNKVANGNLRHKGDSSQDSKSRSRKVSHHQLKFAARMDSSPETNFEMQMEAKSNYPAEQQSMVDAVTIAEPGSPTMSWKSSELLPTPSPSAVDGGKPAIHDLDESKLQEQKQEPAKHRAEPDSSESSKEADHPSPISVLEVPFAEETSTSESFERVSAELHELRLQLKLLKMESGAYPTESSLGPAEDNAAQLSPSVSEGNHAGSITWETSYIIDILVESGLEESDFDIFRTRWHAPDTPLDPSLFDHLEKKHGNGTNESRSERRFLFNLLNTAILEIFHDHVDMHPWVTQKLGERNLKSKQGIRDALDKLIKQEFVDGDQMLLVGTLDKEMRWSGARREIDVIGTELEELLIDDLVIELLLLLRS